MILDSNRIKVMSFIENNFNLDDVTLKQVPLYPGGILLTDKTGSSILFYHDIEKQEIKWKEINK